MSGGLRRTIQRRAAVWSQAACAATIVAYLFYFAGPGLRAGISGDDLMNISGSWRVPIWRHIADISLFFDRAATFRPCGSLFYSVIFATFGLNGTPFRIACYILLVANLGLSYLLVVKLTRSREVAAVACLLLAYHAQFFAYYLNSGVCYDLLCFFFYVAAFVYYLRIREFVRTLQVVSWSSLYVLALNSKEMAVTLPVVIGIYELLENPPVSCMPRALAYWLWHKNRIAVVGSLITGLFIAGRVSRSSLTAISDYQPVLSLGTYLDRAFHFLRFALYEPSWLTRPMALILLGVLVAAAIRAHLTALRLGVLWMMIGVLPVAFIRQRGLDAVVIPALALAMCLAVVIVALSRSSEHAWRGVTTFTVLLVALVIWNSTHDLVPFDAGLREGRHVQAVLEQLRRLTPPLQQDSKVLFVHDPFPDYEWWSSFLVHLYFRSGPQYVERMDRLVRQTDQSRKISFDLVLSYESGRLVRCAVEPFRNVTISETVSRHCLPSESPWQSLRTMPDK